MSKKEDMTAWEKLALTKRAMETILNKTAKGEPSLTAEEVETMQQDLILIVGAAAIFSAGLAFGDVHTVVPNGTEVADHEGE